MVSSQPRGESLGARSGDMRGFNNSCEKSRWLPIETAPKDGTRILAWPCEIAQKWVGVGISAGYEPVIGIACVTWNRVYSRWEYSPSEATEYDPDEHHPTYWMPLPEAPE